MNLHKEGFSYELRIVGGGALYHDLKVSLRDGPLSKNVILTGFIGEKNILMRLKSGDVKLINKKNHYFSRIHVDDISNILFKSLSKFKSGEIYNLSDDKPSTSEDVTLFGAKMLNIKNIEKIEVDQIKSEMLKNFYNESKKVSNKKVKSYFNYNLKFPSYIEGLNYIRSNFI